MFGEFIKVSYMCYTRKTIIINRLRAYQRQNFLTIRILFNSAKYTKLKRKFLKRISNEFQIVSNM